VNVPCSCSSGTLQYSILVCIASSERSGANEARLHADGIPEITVSYFGGSALENLGIDLFVSHHSIFQTYITMNEIMSFID
jgi:hypothetical protein